ncbi:MAG: hypothetical protein WBE26_12175 [Phycisphaerae bacterium]
MLRRVAIYNTAPILFFCVWLLWCCQSSTLFGCEAQSSQSVNWRSLAFGRTLLRKGDLGRLVTMEYGEIPQSVRLASENQIGLRLQPDAIPLRAISFETRLAAANDRSEDDIIEYRWRFADQDLCLFESLNAIQLEIKLEQLARNESWGRGSSEELARVKSLVRQIIKHRGRDGYGKDYEIDIPWHEMLDDGVAFSSNSQKSIVRLQSWHERIDFSIEDGTLHILMYHRVAKIPGYRDGSKWFPDDFRQVIQKKVREQGKLPTDYDKSGK